jgi:tetratricopeptide (TPR) repeat protein
MKQWYEAALDQLKIKLNSASRVNGLEFLEDFVLENRDVYFEDLEFEDVDNFVSEEFDSFQKWLEDNKNQFVNVNKNGKWYSNTAKKRSPTQIKASFNLTSDEAKLLELEALGLQAGKIKEFIDLYQKLESTNFHEMKFKCAFRLAKCGELSRDIPENELIEFWMNASVAAIKANLIKEACECKAKAAYHHLRTSNHEEAAVFYEEAFNIVKEIKFKNKMQLLKNARIQYQLFGNHEEASRLFSLEKSLEYKDAPNTKKIALLLYCMASNYGESPKRVLWNCFWVLLISTFIVFGLEIAVGKDQVANSLTVFINSGYFSVVTFTTLGYGDFYPTNPWGQLCASVISLLGLIYSSLFMVTVVRKYSRS